MFKIETNCAGSLDLQFAIRAVMLNLLTTNHSILALEEPEPLGGLLLNSGLHGPLRLTWILMNFVYMVSKILESG